MLHQQNFMIVPTCLLTTFLLLALLTACASPRNACAVTEPIWAIQEEDPFEAEASCCYPTRFQTSGLYFPTEACREVMAAAADRKLSFVVWVQP